MNSKQRHHEFFLTQRPKSSHHCEALIQEAIPEQPKSSQSVLEEELRILKEEQELYDAFQDFELKLMNLRSDVRRQISEKESYRSQVKTLQFLIDSQFKSLQSTVNSSVDSLKEKLSRCVGHTEGYSEFVQHGIQEQKKEDEIFRQSMARLEKRIYKLEIEIGIYD